MSFIYSENHQQTINIEELLKQVTWNKDGLVAAITQDSTNNEVLMMAWMNHDSLLASIKTGFACYYSRSRQSFWKKGETSGHIQKIKSIQIDCDGDTLLLKVEQTGCACHTGAKTCFYQILK